MKTNKPNRFLLTVISWAGFIFAAPCAFAQSYYWDGNDNASGFGTAGGTWAAPTTGTTTSGWGTDSTGATTVNGNSVTTATTDTSENFGTATDGLAAGTVAVSGAVSSGNLVFGAASGAIVLSGGTSITLPASATITVNNTADTISMPLLGAATSLEISGASGSTLNLGGSPPATPTLTIDSGVTMNFSGNQTFAGNLSGAGTLAMSGSGTLTFSAISALSSFTGGIILNSGLLSFSPTTAVWNNNSLTFNGTSTFACNNSIAAAANPNGGVAINGTSTIAKFGGNTKTWNFGGPLTGNGILSLAQQGQGGDHLLFNSTANTFTGPIQYAGTKNGQTYDFTANSLADSAGAGSISFGIATSGGAQTFTYGSGATAPLTLNNRQFILAGNQLTQSINNAGTQAFTINTHLSYTGTGTQAKVLTLGSTGTGISTFAGNLVQGSGTATLAITKTGSGTWILGGTNSYTAGTNITTGTLQFAKLVAMSATGAVAAASGTTLAVNVGGTGEWTTATSGNGTIGGLLGGLGGQAGGTVTYAGTATVGLDTSNASPATQTYGGSIANVGTSLGIKKLGANTLELAGTNTYTGATTVSAGTLAVTGSLGGSAVTVVTGATLAGNGNIGGNVTIQSGAHHALAVAATAGAQVTRAITGTLTLTGSILDLSAASTPLAGTYVLATATTAITGAPATINYNGISGTVSVDTGSSPQRLLLTVTGPGPGPVDHFVISAIGSPQTVGAAITGITITALDVSENTATGFTGTVNFGGTAGCTGTTGNFVLGVLTPANATPTVAGSNLTLTVDDGAGHSGSTTITTVQTLYQMWAASNAPTTTPAQDQDGDGVSNAVEYVLGGTIGTKDLGKLPKVSTAGGNMLFSFERDQASIGNATVVIEVSPDLATWPDAYSVGADSDGSSPGVTVNKNTPTTGVDTVTLSVPQSGGGKFARLKVVVPTP